VTLAVAPPDIICIAVMQIAVNCIVSFAFSCDVKRRQSVSARNQTVIQREARAALRMKASEQDVRAAS